MSYLTVENHEKSTIIRRSEFIAIVRRVKNEEELFAELGVIRKRYFDATHVCYASVFDKTGSSARFSDDGEPGGTAGAPILEAIKGANLKETLVAVVRYFGGVKLGAGGLVRAYSSSASEALKEAKKIKCELTDFYELYLDFSTAKRAQSALERKNLKVVKVEYSSAVTLTLAVKSGEEITQTVADIIGATPNLIKTKTDFSEQKI